MKKAIVRKDSYFDSVFLMSLSKQLKTHPGVSDAVVAMGTAMNLELLSSQGYSASELAGAGPNDLLMAVDCAEEPAVEAAFKAAGDLLARKRTSSGFAGRRRRGRPASTRRSKSCRAPISRSSHFREPTRRVKRERRFNAASTSCSFPTM